MTYERTPQEIIADVLSRYSVADLREMSDETLDRAEALLDKNAARPEVLSSGTTNLIRWWRIRSTSGKKYEVRRFENFVFCSCMDFFFSKTTCKHIFVTTNSFHQRENREADKALKPIAPRPDAERIAGIRIN
jgi:hypothetical protein